MAGEPAELHSGLRLGRKPADADAAIVGPVFEYSVSVNPLSIGADAVIRTAVTLAGVKVGDAVIAVPPSDLEAGLNALVPFVSAADTVQLPILNDTAGAIDGAAKTWKFLVIRFA